MKKALTVLNKLIHPPKWVLFTAPAAVFSALIFVFIKGFNDSVPAYIIYCLSAYCLAILVIPLPGAVKKARNGIRTWLSRSQFGKRYLEDLAFRGSIGIFQGMIINFLYVAFRIFVGIRHASVWFITMAVYYLVLGIMRLSLAVSYTRRTPEKEIACYRRTALLLFLLNLPMGAMITLMVMTDSGYSYPGYIIYVSAAYTFYMMIVSVINIFKFRKLGSPILSAAKALNFVTAMMSVLGLQTAMIAQFSSEGESFRIMMNAITGGSVWFGVILTAVCMLFISRKMKIKSEVAPSDTLGK